MANEREEPDWIKWGSEWEEEIKQITAFSILVIIIAKSLASALKPEHEWMDTTTNFMGTPVIFISSITIKILQQLMVSKQTDLYAFRLHIAWY